MKTIIIIILLLFAGCEYVEDSTYYHSEDACIDGVYKVLIYNDFFGWTHTPNTQMKCHYNRKDEVVIEN
jgi:hypothetical protein